MYDLANEKIFDVNGRGNKNPRNRSVIRLPKSPANMASGISTVFLPDNPNEPCERLNLILQEKQAGNNFNIFNDEFVAIVHKLLGNKSKFTKQHKQLLFECDLLHTKKK